MRAFCWMVVAASLLAACGGSRAVAPAVVLGIEAPPPGPLSQTQLTAVARDIRQLEAHPLATDAEPVRQALFFWLTGSPDVHISLCPALVGPLLESDTPYAPLLLTQYTLSMAAFTIEAPEQAEDAVAVAGAGVQGMLHTYRILHEQARAREPFLNTLLGREKDGTLDAFIDDRVDECE